MLDAVPLPLLYQTDRYERTDLGGILFDFESSYIQVAAAAKLTGQKHVNLTVRYR